jgi:hypothetical protein
VGATFEEMPPIGYAGGGHPKNQISQSQITQFLLDNMNDDETALELRNYLEGAKHMSGDATHEFFDTIGQTTIDEEYIEQEDPEFEAELEQFRLKL